MARQLVVCLDGTGNSFCATPTNVVRLLRSLNPDLDEVLPYYDQGVGTFGLQETLFEWQKKPSRVLGLAFGWGLARTVESAYRFLAMNYRPDDEIYIFGFSRGAYSVRCLAALVHACGLVQPHQLNLFDYAWAMLTARKKVKIAPSSGVPPAATPGAAPAPPPQEYAPDFALQNQFKGTFGRDVPIKFLGLFDTVKSVGWVYDPTVIPYTSSNSSVQIVRHAMSIDERRVFFRQESWSYKAVPQTDVLQVWFAGVHSDIGGGYPPEEAQLAGVSFCWMLGEAIAHGLKVDHQRCLGEMRLPNGCPPDLTGDMHNSMETPWKMAEWAPTYLWYALAKKRKLAVGAMPPFGKPRPRAIPEDSVLHVSVKKRLLERPEYRPPNLPQAYTIANDNPKSPCS